MTCPNCSAEIGTHKAWAEVPAPGNVVICRKCERILLVQADSTLREISLEQRRQIAIHDRLTWAHVETMKRMVLGKEGGP
jgi:C4-type Zn-finger protein